MYILLAALCDSDVGRHKTYQKSTNAPCSQDYFSSTVGAVKRVLLNYNKVGRSVGVATITFQKASSASEAAKQYDGVKVDGKPMKVRMHAVVKLFE